MSNFPTINRYAIIIEPAEEYLEWAKSCPDAIEITLDGLQVESTVYLMPETDAEPERWLKRNFKPIFEQELYAWYTDDNYWPKKLTYKLFKEFFNIRFATMILDMGKYDIEREYIIDEL